MNEWDVICAIATGAVIEAENDGTYRLVTRIADVPGHIVNRLNELGMLQGPNNYRLSDYGLRYYMRRVDGQDVAGVLGTGQHTNGDHTPMGEN